MFSIHENGRVLTKDGHPFFYLADTAWELFHRLTLKEADGYFRNRSELGFTVIQAVLLSELNGVMEPNANGDLPLSGGDLAKPNQAYFTHCRDIALLADKYGLTMGILPSWGCHWQQDENGRALIRAENARKYGAYLTETFRGLDVIWILGGDRMPRCEAERETIRQLAKELRTGGDALITFHPMGPGQSSAVFHNEEWMRFNMNQTSHAAPTHPNQLFIARDYALTPVKPTLDGEPRYEQLPMGFYNKGHAALRRFDDADVRRAAYAAVFSGACGHTYGNNNVWQMYDKGRTPVIGANQTWRESLHHPGARQMGYLRALMERMDFSGLRPAQALLLQSPAAHEGVFVLLASDASRLLAYSPYGRPFTLDNGWRRGTYRESWFCPKYNTCDSFLINDLTAPQTYVPPSEGNGHDWVLCMETV